jgi:hypothetical protein
MSVKSHIRHLTLVFGSGCLGALANSLVTWLLGLYGITRALGVDLAPALSPVWLYPRLVWGGIWGLLFLLPIYKNRPLRQGLLLSLGPTLVQLFVVFPYRAHRGMMGLGLGALTPFFVILLNAVWGVVTALWLRALRD